MSSEEFQALKSLFNERFDKMDSRFDKMESRLDSMDSRFDSIESRLDSVESRLDTLEENVAEIRSATNHLLEWADKVSIITKVAL